MDFDSIDSFYSNLVQTMGIALKEAMEEARKKAYEYIENEWYGRYNPKFYSRTSALLNSLEIDYEMVGNEMIATLYVIDEQHPESNSWTYRNFDEVYEWFAKGEAYGEERYGENLDVIKYTQEELFETREIFNIIKSVLSSYGFDIG